MATRHFISLLDFSEQELLALLQRAMELKAGQRAGGVRESLKNKVLGMVFEKSSTRTRASFETAMIQCGGGSVFLSPRDTHLGRGEPIEDTARVLSRMVDCAVLRTYAHEAVEIFAAYSRVPVINALSAMYHPCQLLADMQTYFEHRGDIRGKTVAWIGDGNNMCHSYLNAARRFGFKLRVACPAGYEPNANLLTAAGARAELMRDPTTAVRGANLVVTDVWASMGQEEQQSARQRAFDGYQVTQTLMNKAAPGALFMHCLPAHRGEEVAAEVIDGKQSVVWDEAENRLHSQKALLEFLLCGQG